MRRVSIKQRLLPPNGSRARLAEWIEDAAQVGQSPTWRVLDAGAGDAPYRHLFDHVKYETADSGATITADRDYDCDLAALPMDDDTYDQVLCTQVLEHVADPQAVLNELARVVRPGGAVWASAPLFYEEHGGPHDYRRFTQYGWRQMAEQAGLEVREIGWLEGYDDTLAYQCEMAVRQLRGWSMTPIRALFLMLAHLFAWRGARHQVTDRGMPKNYRCVMVKPLTADAGDRQERQSSRVQREG